MFGQAQSISQVNNYVFPGFHIVYTINMMSLTPLVSLRQALTRFYIHTLNMILHGVVLVHTMNMILFKYFFH